MDLLNGLIQVISDDFSPINNNSIPVDHLNNKIELEKEKKEPTIDSFVIDLLDTFKQWKISIEFIESQCPLYDYKDVKANGYRTIFKINIQAIKRINKILSAKQLTAKHLIKCLTLAKLLDKINSKIKEYNLLDKEFKQNLHNNNESINQMNCDVSNTKLTNQELLDKTTSPYLFTSVLSIDFFKFYHDLESDLSDYFRFHKLFYYRKGLGKNARRVVNFCSTSSNLPASLVFSNKKKSKVIAKALNNPTISFPFSILNQVDCSLHNDIAVPLKYIGGGLSVKTIYISRQKKFSLFDLNTCINDKKFIKIDPTWSYESVKIDKLDKKDRIRIRILKKKSTPKSGTVIFYIHGGAFVFHSPEAHETYTREFAKQLPETVFVSVAYRTRSAYPSAHQDCLDAWLWLTSGLNEVEEVLGFHPKKILISGDSAGAFLSLATIYLLKDFNKIIETDYPEEKRLRTPDALFSFYGFYNLTNTSPALFSSILDFFLPPSNIRIAFGSLIWGVEECKFKRRIFLPFTDKKERWYNLKNLEKTANQMVKHFIDIPYIDMIHNFDFNSCNIPLYIVTSDIDLCLDHNIDLANRWKGDVSIHTCEDIIHGFLQLGDGDKTISEDISKSIELMRTAIDRL